MAVAKNKTALVAGGAGFLGSHLCDALISDGYHVVSIDNFLTGTEENLAHLRGHPRFVSLAADIIDPLPDRLSGLLCGSPPLDVVFNLACAASPPRYQADPEHTLLTSVLGTRNLLRLAESHAARFLLASTSEIYGDPEIHPQREDYRGSVNCTGPRACYDEGKRAAETLCYDYARAGRVDVRVARIFNTYGPRMRPDDGRVISNAVVQALAGRPVTLFGDGSQTRSFCYVTDMIDGLRRLADHPGPVPGPVNLGNEDELPVGDLAARVVRLTGSASPIVTRPLPVDDPRRRRPDAGLARTLLGWQARTDLDTGLRATIAWFGESGETRIVRAGRAAEIHVGRFDRRGRLAAAALPARDADGEGLTLPRVAGG